MKAGGSVPLVKKMSAIGAVKINVTIEGINTVLKFSDSFGEQGEIEVKGNLFYALGALSQKYQKKDVLIGCKGCLRYAFSSGLVSESMLGEFVPYMDGTVSVQDAPLVNIFEAVEEKDFLLLSYFDQQKEERKKILAKFKNKK